MEKIIERRRKQREYYQKNKEMIKYRRDRKKEKEKYIEENKHTQEAQDYLNFEERLLNAILNPEN